ncbi:MAG TPA: hypothetical protein VF915_14375 [Reyranella sp.]
MSGKIIEFRGHHGLKRANLYRRQTVPRGLTREVRLKLQIARISTLLEELEELAGAGTGTSTGAAPPLVVQTRTIIERTNQLLDRSDEGDPQPDVDRALLERMYRDLNLST